MPLPTNYQYSSWVLKSKAPVSKPKYALNGNDEPSNILEHKYQVPKP